MQKELNFKIGGVKKSSLLDYPDKISAIVFTQGCNFNCGFCHNPSLLPFNKTANINNCEKEYKASDFLNFLETRKGKLDGAVITGGEPCLQKDLKPFIKEIKKMGFLVKLDTNGSFPDTLKDLLNENLLDYAAMDIKAPLKKYFFTANVNIDTEKIRKSIDIIMHSGIKYEFRTTFMPYLHTFEDFEETGRLIQGAELYYLQKFEARTEINNPALKNEKNYSDEDIEKIKSILKKYIKDVRVR